MAQKETDDVKQTETAAKKPGAKRAAKKGPKPPREPRKSCSEGTLVAEIGELAALAGIPGAVQIERGLADDAVMYRAFIAPPRSVQVDLNALSTQLQQEVVRVFGSFMELGAAKASTKASTKKTAGPAPAPPFSSYFRPTVKEALVDLHVEMLRHAIDRRHGLKAHLDAIDAAAARATGIKA